MQRINQMVDIEETAPDIENFQHKSEERDAAQHHVGQVAEQGADKKPHFRSVFTHLLFRPSFDPAFKRRGGFRIVKNDEWPLADLDRIPLLICALGGRRCALVRLWVTEFVRALVLFVAGEGRWLS